MLDQGTLIPAWRLTLDGTDLTTGLAPRLISLTLRDLRGMEADQLDLVLDDHAHDLELPTPGAALELSLGWRVPAIMGLGSSSLTDMGRYLVDEIEWSTPPSTLAVRARSADLSESLTTPRTQAWDSTTLGTLVSEIAGRSGLTPEVGADLGGEPIAHLDQQQESDANLLTRLAERYGATATAKAGRLLLFRRGSGQDLTGAAMAAALIRLEDCRAVRYRQARREGTYTGVVAWWQDTAQAKRQRVLVGEDDKVRELRDTFATEAEALGAADAERRRLARDAGGLTLELATGRPAIQPETPLTLRGFREAILSLDWVAAEVTHTLDSSGGYTTTVDAELLGG